MSYPNARIVLKRGSAALFSNGKRIYYIDTLALERGLEEYGIPSKDLILAMAQFVFREKMQEEHYFSLQRSLQREAEEHRVKIEKMISGILGEDEKIREIRYHGEKMRSMMLASKEKLRNAICEDTSHVITKIRALNAQTEEATDRLMKCLIGAIGLSAGLAFIRHHM